MVFEAIAVTVAMYSLIQFFLQIRLDIAEHKPLLKVAAIKLVIFLSFWQTILISFLTSAGAIKATKKVQTPDIKVGVPALLLCIEMALFAIFHIWSFSWRPYTESHENHGGFLGVKAIIEAFNVYDMLKATGRAAKWLFKDRKHRENDVSYKLSRKDTQGSDLDPEGHKPSNASPAYGRDPRVVHDTGLEGGEGENLLASSQAMPTSRPLVERRESDRSDSGNDSDDPNDIGLATSSYDDKYPTQPHFPAQTSYQPYRGQESGAFAAPYPGPRLEQSGHSTRDNRISMPYMPPQRSPDPRMGGGNPNEGNFL